MKSLPARVLEGGRLLDVGSGLGQLSRVARDFGLDYAGLEPSDALRTAATQDFREAVFLAKGAEDLSVEARPADVVVLNGVAHHLNDDLLERAFQAARTARALILCDHLRQEGTTHALAKFLQDRDQGKFVRPYDQLKSLPGLVLQSSQFFPIGPLGLPFWTYFCNVYTPA